MKLNTLFVAAVCASTMLSSCVFETAQENQLKYTHTSLVDGDAFAVIQIVNGTAVDGIKHAEAATEAKDVAAKVKGFYTQFLPQLDSISTKFDVTLYPVPVYTAAATDTLAQQEVAHSHQDYTHQAQQELSVIKLQLERLTRNTNEHLQIFAKEQLTKASTLFVEIGGKDEGHAHH